MAISLKTSSRPTSPERAESLGRSRPDGAMAHPRRRASGTGSRARRGARVPVLAAVLTRATRPSSAARIQLVRKNYQIVGVMPPRFRWREADIYVPLKVRLEPNIYYGATLKIRPGVSRSRKPTPNCSRSCRSSRSRRRTRYPDTFRVNLRSIIEMYARPMGPQALPAARRRDVAAARGLRQRVDPAARARRAPPAGARRPRGARSRTHPRSCSSC